MHVSQFDYELPPELIAQQPLAERDRSRMLVVNRARGEWQDRSFADLPEHLAAGDCLVINNTRVFPARLIGHRILGSQPGAKIEVLLTRRVKADEWEALAKPGRALPVGAQLEFGTARLRGEVTAILDDGRRRIRFETEEDFDRVVDEIGHTPLPPYIKRAGAESARLIEPRYQTIFAKLRGSIAAPTAGLHFTERIFAELRERGVQTAEITHHVGVATFQTVRVEQVEEHRIESEQYEISAAAAATINAARRAGGRIMAVGTTTTRALESAADERGMIRAERRPTELFIHPGYRFKAIDGLLTNFHLPQSTLLMLVSALGGRELILSAYRHAVAQRYRFYSYGDCMLIT